MDLFEHGGEFHRTDKILYDFSINVNPLGMPKGVKDAIKSLLDGKSLSAYPDRKSEELKAAIGEKEKVDKSGIVLGNGASELIMAICNYYKPNSVMTLKPTFSGYKRASINYCSRLIEVASIQEMSKYLGDVNLIFICNPNNPTGKLIDLKDIRELLDNINKLNDLDASGISNIDNAVDISKAENTTDISKNENKTNITVTEKTIVVIDECFIDFTGGESSIGLLKKYDNLIVLKAFTKFYGMAGIRLGYLLSNEMIANGINSYLPEWNISSIAQAAGLAALKDSDYCKKTIDLLEKEKRYLCTCLKKIGVEYFDSDCNFLLIKTPFPIYKSLIEKGIAVRDCSNFSGLNENYIRVCISTHENNEVLIKKLSQALIEKE